MLAPLVLMHLGFLITLSIYLCFHRTKLWKANRETKIQFLLLFLVAVFSLTLLSLFIYT